MSAGLETVDDLCLEIENLISTLAVDDPTASNVTTYHVVETVTGVATNASDLQHLGVSVMPLRSANTDEYRGRDDRRVEDTVVITFHYQISPDQRASRRRAIRHAARIRDEVDRLREFEAEYQDTDFQVEGGWFRIDLTFTFHRRESIYPARITA